MTAEFRAVRFEENWRPGWLLHRLAQLLFVLFMPLLQEVAALHGSGVAELIGEGREFGVESGTHQQASADFGLEAGWQIRRGGD